MKMLGTWYRSDFLTLDEATELLVAEQSSSGQPTGPWDRRYQNKRNLLLDAINIGEIALSAWNSTIDQGRQQFICRCELKAWLLKKRMIPATFFGMKPSLSPEITNSPLGKSEQAREWICAILKASPDRRSQTKSEMRHHARRHFNLSGREFDHLWKVCIHECGAYAWNRAGRPSNRL